MADVKKPKNTPINEDGGIAYSQGFKITDNPFEGSAAETWKTQWLNEQNERIQSHLIVIKSD